MYENIKIGILNSIEQNNFTDSQLGDWSKLYDKAKNSCGDPLPCPLCYIQFNLIERLKAEIEEKQTGTVKCKKCKNIFKYELNK